jgi:hypothetical protein
MLLLLAAACLGALPARPQTLAPRLSPAIVEPGPASAASTPEPLERLFSGALPLPSLDLSGAPLQDGLLAAPKSTVRQDAHSALAKARTRRAAQVTRVSDLQKGVAALPAYGGETHRLHVEPLQKEAAAIWKLADQDGARLEGSAAALIEPGHGLWAWLRRLFDGPYKSALALLEKLDVQSDKLDEGADRAAAALASLRGLPEEAERALTAMDRALAELERADGPSSLMVEVPVMRIALDQAKPRVPEDPRWALDKAGELGRRIAELDSKLTVVSQLEERRRKGADAIVESRRLAGEIQGDLSELETAYARSESSLAEAERALKAADFDATRKALDSADKSTRETRDRIEAAAKAGDRREIDLAKFELERRRLEALATERALALQQLGEKYSETALAPAAASRAEAEQALPRAAEKAKEAGELLLEGRPLGYLDAFAKAYEELARAKAALQLSSEQAAALDAADRGNAAAIEELSRLAREAEGLPGLDEVAGLIQAAKTSSAASPRDPAEAEASLKKARTALDQAAKLEFDRGVLYGLDSAVGILEAKRSGYGTMDYWIHHHAIRRDMANALGYALRDLAGKVNEPSLRAALGHIASNILSTYQTGYGDLHYWARMATLQDNEYDALAQRLEVVKSKLPAPKGGGLLDAFERGLAEALAPAAKALLAHTTGHGTIDYWIHHFEVRREAGNAAARSLRRLAALGRGESRSGLERIASSLESAVQTGYGDVHYWAQMASNQDRDFRGPADAMLNLGRK